MMLNNFHVFFFKDGEKKKDGEGNLVLEIGFWSIGCILILFSITYHEDYLKGKGHEQPHRPCEY